MGDTSIDHPNGLTMDTRPPPSHATNIDLLEEVYEKNLYQRMPGFVGLRDETDPLKAEKEAMKATVNGTSSPAPVVDGPQRATGESFSFLLVAFLPLSSRKIAVLAESRSTSFSSSGSFESLRCLPPISIPLISASCQASRINRCTCWIEIGSWVGDQIKGRRITGITWQVRRCPIQPL
jgi:hypothetical protein